MNAWLLWVAWTLAALAVARACLLAVDLYQQRRLQRRKQQVDRELADLKERLRLDALTGLPVTYRRVHVPLQETQRRMRRHG
jgi:hypothetical protein